MSCAADTVSEHAKSPPAKKRKSEAHSTNSKSAKTVVSVPKCLRETSGPRERLLRVARAFVLSFHVGRPKPRQMRYPTEQVLRLSQLNSVVLNMERDVILRRATTEFFLCTKFKARPFLFVQQRE